MSIIKGLWEPVLTLDRHKESKGPTVEDILAIQKEDDNNDESTDDDNEIELRNYLSEFKG